MVGEGEQRSLGAIGVLSAADDRGLGGRVGLGGREDSNGTEVARGGNVRFTGSKIITKVLSLATLNQVMKREQKYSYTYESQSY